jgi:hypothetical protein
MESNNENITTFTDSIVFDTIKDIASRAEAGLNKYNKTMDREDLIASDWVQHAYEECLDMALYLKRLRKDMLAMEEELRAFKTANAIREMMKENHTLTWVAKKADPFPATADGTKFVYKTIPKPNNTYTDEEPVIRKKYAWHR